MVMCWYLAWTQFERKVICMKWWRNTSDATSNLWSSSRHCLPSNREGHRCGPLWLLNKPPSRWRASPRAMKKWPPNASWKLLVSIWERSKTQCGIYNDLLPNTVLVTRRVVKNHITHVFCLVSGPQGGYKTNSTLIQIFHLANFHVDGIFYQMH